MSSSVVRKRWPGLPSLSTIVIMLRGSFLHRSLKSGERCLTYTEAKVMVKVKGIDEAREALATHRWSSRHVRP